MGDRTRHCPKMNAAGPPRPGAISGNSPALTTLPLDVREAGGMVRYRISAGFAAVVDMLKANPET